MRILLKQGGWYLFAGASAALLELVLFSVLCEGAALNIVVANILATLVATAYNFMVNRNLTFKSTSNPRRSLVLYVLLFLANMALSTGVIVLLVGWGLPSPVAKAIMQVCVMAWNFVLYKKVVFR